MNIKTGTLTNYDVKKWLDVIGSTFSGPEEDVEFLLALDRRANKINDKDVFFSSLTKEERRKKSTAVSNILDHMDKRFTPQEIEEIYGVSFTNMKIYNKSVSILDSFEGITLMKALNLGLGKVIEGEAFLGYEGGIDLPLEHRGGYSFHQVVEGTICYGSLFRDSKMYLRLTRAELISRKNF